MFVAGFATADLVGTCERLDDPQAPVWSKVQVSNVEAVGGGTLAWDEATDRVAPHIHVAVGLKEHSATGHTSHLLGATVQFLTEMIIVEVTEPGCFGASSPTSTTCRSFVSDGGRGPSVVTRRGYPTDDIPCGWRTAE